MNTPSALTFADPSAIVDQLNIELKSQVADFGCGSGFFSFEFAKRVGAEGVVYALDILPAALEAVASRAKILNLSNIITKRANLEKENGSGLAPQSMDWVVIKDILFQNENKKLILGEVSRVLKSGGHAILMEWNPKESLVGPDVELRITPEQLRSLVEAAHLAVEKELNVGGFHYAFLVKK
jgi:ubiquinone/menaquinone biosynthesis C-methylase UbiE